MNDDKREPKKQRGSYGYYTNWAGIAEYLGFRPDQIDEVKALKLPPYDSEAA